MQQGRLPLSIEVSEKEEPKVKERPKNALNDLTGKEWVAFTKSWFIINPPRRNSRATLHPAKYPESLVYDFLQFFTRHQSEDVVLDPFCGTGSTLVAIDQINNDYNGNRRGIGIELNPNYADIAQEQTTQQVEIGDAASYDLTQIPELDFIMTSPPYWNVLHKNTGHINTARRKKGLDTVYSDSNLDLGNIKDYDQFIDTTVTVIGKFTKNLKNRRFCVVVLSSTNRGGQFYPIPYDFAARFQEKWKQMIWKGERIWCQDNKALMPYGYPYSFVPNFTHHSCLIFRKEE